MTETKARFTPERLNELEQLARAATPGPWIIEEMTHFGEPGTGYASVTGAPRLPEDKRWKHGESDKWSIVLEDDIFIEDARHIAAFDPPTVLTLLSEVRALRESVKAYREWREAFIDYGLAELTESGPTLQQAERLAKAEPALSPSSTAKEPTP